MSSSSSTYKQLNHTYNPKISVCMATYNGQKYIKKQIDSILLQLNEDDELIISDDGSTDNTLNIIKHYADNRILLLHHEPISWHKKYYQTNARISANFENAISHATGDIILLSDQDDIWQPNKITATIDFMYDNPNCEVAISSIIVINKDDIYQKKTLPNTTILSNSY